MAASVRLSGKTMPDVVIPLDDGRPSSKAFKNAEICVTQPPEADPRSSVYDGGAQRTPVFAARRVFVLLIYIYNIIKDFIYSFILFMKKILSIFTKLLKI